MNVKQGLGLSLLMACGGGSGEDVRQRAEAERADRSRGVAGGETSEFSGDIGSCPEIVSSAPLDLDDPEVASWVALAQGHHEQTLRWQRGVLSEALRGFEEHTTLAIDVDVLRGREVVYGSAGISDPEVEGCNGLRARQIELDIELATADGAVVAAFQRWYEPWTNSGSVVLDAGALNPDNDGEVAFGGSLELGLDPALGGTSFMWVTLSFAAGSVQGRLSPEQAVRDERYVPNRSSWTPIQAIFPDDACQGDGTPISLDEVVVALGETPRTIHQRTLEAWGREPVPGIWTAAPYGVVLPGVEAPPPTEVTLTLGAPTQACGSGDWATVHTELTIASADGRVNLLQPIALSFGGNGASVDAQTPWVPAADFDAQMGTSGVNLDAGSYGAVHFDNAIDVSDDRVSGMLTVHQWDAFIQELAAYPALEWCKGRQCVVEPER